jgi:hypothetical protein
MISIARHSRVEIYRLYRGTNFPGLQSTTEDGKLIVKPVIKKWDVGLFSGEQFYVKQSLEFSFCSFTKCLVRVAFFKHSFLHHSFIHSVVCLTTGP